MNQWAKVVVYPLGLAGFSLFMLYMFSRTHELPLWLFPTATLVALVGGLLLALMDRSRQIPDKNRPSNHQPSAVGDRSDKTITETDEIRQSTQGSKSPNMANVIGDI